MANVCLWICLVGGRRRSRRGGFFLPLLGSFLGHKALEWGWNKLRGRGNSGGRRLRRRVSRGTRRAMRRRSRRHRLPPRNAKGRFMKRGGSTGGRRRRSRRGGALAYF